MEGAIYLLGSCVSYYISNHVAPLRGSGSTTFEREIIMAVAMTSNFSYISASLLVAYTIALIIGTFRFGLAMGVAILTGTLIPLIVLITRLVYPLSAGHDLHEMTFDEDRVLAL